MQETYQITVDCHLDDRWSDRFEGFQLDRRDDGTTVMTGSLEDQTALHGILSRIAQLNIPLLSVDKKANQDGGRAPP